MADTFNNSAFIHRRHRLMWPTTDGRCFHGLAIRAEREAAPNAKVLADIFIDNELAICGGLDDLRIGDLSDTEEIASSQIMKRPQNQVALLHALYLRTRQQSTVWDICAVLVAKGLLYPKALEATIDHLRNSAQVRTVHSLLSCFAYPFYENHVDCGEPPYEFWGSIPFNAPIS